ncbi:MAG: HNH endonuclease [bacterium]|nr:HNH endonuclease [bacterium]
MAQPNWSEDETQLAFLLYCQMSRSQIDARHPWVIELSKLLGIRSPDSVAMKLHNIASCDPAVIAMGLKGLSHASVRDREVWTKFTPRLSDLLWASEQAIKRVAPQPTDEQRQQIHQFKTFVGLTEVTQETVVRRAQRFFRDTVLASYEYKCAVSGIEKRQLLCASHIIPWSQDPDRRTDPQNGLSLSALHDRAFDRGLISFDEAGQLLVSQKLKEGRPNAVIQASILELEGKPLDVAKRFAPDPLALAYHRDRIYKAS